MLARASHLREELERESRAEKALGFSGHENSFLVRPVLGFGDNTLTRVIAEELGVVLAKLLEMLNYEHGNLLLVHF